MTYDNAHSRLVAWGKIVLPLAALVLLSTLFLLSKKVDPSNAIPYASIDVEELAREPRVTAPEFAGMTEDGAALTVTAKTAQPDPNGGAGASATSLSAKLETVSGLTAELSAAEGRIDPTSGQVLFAGGVQVSTSTGYRLQSDRIEARTDRSELIAPGEVQAEAPYGTLEAGSMTLRSTDAGVTHELVFNGGVKLVYQPQN
jgi:lipopolysaccharide export system protein LptC